MLCRVLLAATVLTCTFSREITVHGDGQASTNLIQIKDVICVLLLSGLQKGDLDTNTLEKLQRHNVNIYDMNNESLRQECLLKSLSNAEKENKSYIITEYPNDLRTSRMHNEPSTGNNVAEIQKSEILAPENYFIDKTNLREIDIKGVIEKEHNSNGNVNEKPGDINVTILHESKDQQIQFIENNPTLERVMNFWVTFTQNANTGITNEPTTTDNPTIIPEKVDTTESHTSNSVNEGYLHSRKMDYLNEMLSEFLKSQTVPTTTQVVEKESTDMDIGKKIKAVLAKNGQLYPMNKEGTFGKNVKEINELAEFINIFNKNQNSPEKIVRTSQKETDKDDDDIVKPKDIPYKALMNFRSTTGDNKSEKKMQALKFLTDMLKVNNKFRLNEPFNTETTTQEPIVKNVEQERHDEPKQLGIENENNRNGDLEHVKNLKMMKDPIQIPGRVVSPDVIQEIAEKVKAIVMKDIIKEIPTSDTTVSCMTTSTEKPTTPIKDNNESSVIQTLMALFKEFKAMKDPSKTTTYTPLNTSADENSNFHKGAPSIVDPFNIYGVKPPIANVKQMAMSPYNHNFAPYPFGQFNPPSIHGLHNFNQNIANQVRPITIQTNSGEIPPLVIEMRKPMKVMNQHIILTTVKPAVKHTQEHVHHENSQQFNYHDQNPIYGDLTKKLRIAENVKKEHRESYKDTIEKMKERIKYSPERHHDQGRESRPFVSDHHVSHSHDSFNKHSNSNRHDTHNRAEDRSPESSYRDIITREFLSRLVDSNHHDIISELVASNPHNSRPNEKVNHRSQSHQSDAYERFEHERTHPRFKGHKFHEKLEGIENRPQNSYESHSKTTKKNCCEAVAAREQVPLSKIKPRPRFDDTHFRNFLKSQQKVTDMLERILAAKTKGNDSKTQSNESS